MAETTAGGRVNIPRLILIPSLITLAVTLVRLTGELLKLSEVLFNRDAGGGGALIGITWLAPVFGVYFALRLARAGGRPARPWAVAGRAFAGLVVFIVGGLLAFGNFSFPGQMVVGNLIMATAVIAQYDAWPALFKATLAYGFAARVPVAILMFFAIQGNWGTHYDVVPEGFPPMGFWEKYMRIAFWPQLGLWVAFTVLTGMLFGGLAAVLVSRRNPRARAAEA